MNADAIVYDASRWVMQQAREQLFPGDTVGVRHVPERGAFLIASNHVSYFDPPLVGGPLRRRFAYFARKTLFKPGFASWWLTRVGVIAVDRDSGSDVSALKRTLATLKAGGAVVLFPEGTRSPDGRLQEAKAGVGMIACRSGVPVVPCRVFGVYECFGRHRKLPRLFTRVHLVYGPALYPDTYDPGASHTDRYAEAARRIMAAIAALEAPRRPAV